LHYDFIKTSIERKVKYLNQLSIFVIRAILGAAFADLLSRFFFPRANIVHVAGLGIFLVGMAYVMEYFRNKKKST
jgi:predicted Na+-dependent transporter